MKKSTLTSNKMYFNHIVKNGVKLANIYIGYLAERWQTNHSSSFCTKEIKTFYIIVYGQ